MVTLVLRKVMVKPKAAEDAKFKSSNVGRLPQKQVRSYGENQVAGITFQTVRRPWLVLSHPHFYQPSRPRNEFTNWHSTAAHFTLNE